MRKSGNQLGCFFMVACGVFLSTMDSSMINIALPHIMDSFASSLAQTEWVVLIYLLTISSTLLLWGRVSDRYGKGVIYLLGMLFFACGSFCCFCSPNLPALVGSRCIQGSGAAMMMSTGPAIIRMSVPRQQLGKWIGSLGIATSTGLMTGPLIGGLILHNFSWRTMFLLHVPVSFMVSVFGWIFIAGTLPRYANSESHFDRIGIFVWAILILLGVILLNKYDIMPRFVWLTGTAIFGGGVIFFLRHQLRADEPLLPIALLRQKYYGIAMLTATLSFAVLFFVLILMPFYLKFIIGLSFDRIGYMMMAVPVSLFIVSPLAGRLHDRFGARFLTSMGLLVTCIAVVFLSELTYSSSLPDIAWRLSLLGCGQSIFLSPNSASVLSRVSFAETGITSGMLATSRNLGMLIGVALVGMIFSAFFMHMSGGEQLRNYTVEELPFFMQSFRYTLLIAAALAFCTALVSVRRS